MFNKKSLLMLVTIATIFAAVSAFAVARGSSVFTAPDTLLIAGKELPEGQYDVRWEANGSDAKMTFSVLGITKLTVQGKFVEGDQKFNYSTFIVAKDAAGKKVVKALQFGGKKYSIVLE